jgi:hypothetical protein
MITKAYLTHLIIGLCALFLAVAFFTGCQAEIYKKVWSLSVSGDVHTVGSMNVFTHGEKHIVFILKACPGGTFPTGFIDNFQYTPGRREMDTPLPIRAGRAVTVRQAAPPPQQGFSPLRISAGGI